MSIHIIDNIKYLFNDIKDEEIKYMKDMINEISKYKNFLENKNFIETGSFFGLFSLFLSSFSKTVYSFEPDRLLFNQLAGNIYINNIDNILPFNYGLSEVEGKTTMTRYITDQKEDSVNKEPVFLQTLDSFQIKNLGLIKLNGNELNTIYGGLKTIHDNNFPLIIINNKEELNKEELKLYQILINLGYSFTKSNNFVIFEKTKSISL